MIRFRLGGVSSAHVRFGVSPIHEVVSLVRILLEPHRHPLHQPWLRRRRRLLAGIDTTVLTPYMRPGGYRPDFLDPPPDGDSDSFEDGVRAMLATPLEHVTEELRASLLEGPVDRVAGPLADAAATRDACAEVLRRVWADVLAPEWNGVRLVLDGDLLHRGRELTRGGVAGMIAGLHPQVTLSGATVTVDSAAEVDVDCDQGLRLVPTVFVTDRPQCVTAAHWPPTIYYPARSAWQLWEPPAPPPQIGALLGATRARILTALAVPRSTTATAEVAGVAPGTASEHLAVLRDARLVTSHRLGHQVIHTRTTLGDTLAEPS